MNKKYRKTCYVCSLELFEISKRLFSIARELFPRAYYTVLINHTHDIKLYTVTFQLHNNEMILLADTINKRR